MRFLLILSLFLLACNKNPKQKFEKTIDGFLVKGHVINKTIYDDTFYYYDSNGYLARKDFFRFGKLNGPSIDFFTNGMPSMIINYTEGLRNGVTSYFDTSGRCYYQDYYYYDLVTGPIIYFEKNQEPKSYYFANLQNETIFTIDYKNWKGIENVVEKCINYTVNEQMRDTALENQVLIYLIRPPKFIFDYQLVKKNRIKNEELSVSTDLSTNLPFMNLALPSPKENEYYSVKLSIYDSILKKKTIIYKDIWKELF